MIGLCKILALVFCVVKIEAEPPPGYETTPQAEKDTSNYEYIYSTEEDIESTDGLDNTPTNSDKHETENLDYRSTEDEDVEEKVTTERQSEDYVYTTYPAETKHVEQNTTKENVIVDPQENIIQIDQQEEEPQDDYDSSSQESENQERIVEYNEKQNIQNLVTNKNSDITIHDLSNSGQLLTLVHEHIAQIQTAEAPKSSQEIFQKFERAPLYENESEKPLNPHFEEYDDHAENVANFGEFGAKINARAKTNNHVNRVNYRPNNQINYIRQQTQPRPSKLVQSTQNLVSGHDVLKINEAVGQSIESIKFVSTTESTKFFDNAPQTRNKVIDTVQAPTNKNIYVINQNGNPSSRIQESSSVPVQKTYDLSKQPIIVEEFVENKVTQTIKQESNRKTTTEKFVTTHSVESGGVTVPSTILVTPRPISSNFLAPVTAGVQLEHADISLDTTEPSKNKYEVQVQQSVPYYLGKFEYPMSYAYQQRNPNDTTVHDAVMENFELGQVLLNFPVPSFPSGQQFRQVPPVEIQEEKGEESQASTVAKEQIVPADGKQNKTEPKPPLPLIHPTVSTSPEQQQSIDFNQKEVPITYHFSTISTVPELPKIQIVPLQFKEKNQFPSISSKAELPKLQIVEFKPKQQQNSVPPISPVPELPKVQAVPVIFKHKEQQHQVGHKPQTEQHKPPVQNHHHAVGYPQAAPLTYLVQQRLPFLDTSNEFKDIHQKFGKPTEVPIKYVETPVYTPVQLNYNFQKFPIAQTVHTQYYPEKIPEVPKYSIVPAPQSYPVEKVPEKVRQQNPTEIRVPQENKVPIQQITQVQYKPFNGGPVPVSQQYFITKQYPSSASPPVTFGNVFNIPHISSAPQNNQQKYIQNYQVYFGNDQHQIPQQLYSQYVSSGSKFRTHSSPNANHNYDQEVALSVRNHQFSYNSYVGLVPPKVPSTRFLNQNTGQYRKARSNFGNNIKLEYGFLPPMVPSLEIDENGNPVHKDGEE